jgi:hypothetical protein
MRGILGASTPGRNADGTWPTAPGPTPPGRDERRSADHLRARAESSYGVDVARPSAAAASTPADRWRIAAIIAGVALLLALMETSRNYFSNALFGRPTSWWSGFAGIAPNWLVIAGLSPLPLWLASAAPITRIDRARSLTAHLGGALLFATLQTACMTLHGAWTRGSFADLGVMISKSSGTFAVSMLMYAAIVGAVHALQFYREVQAREVAETQLQASLTQARLAALRGQINPHFLFNTLNAISTMALADRKDDVVRMLGYLGELLRVSLDDDRPQEVPLHEELDFLERYLDIQRARLGERLTIEIRAARRDGRLRVEIVDSGPGPRAGAPAGIGLANTRARLTQLYRDDQALTLARGDDGRGAHVILEVPCRLVPARTRRPA